MRRRGSSIIVEISRLFEQGAVITEDYIEPRNDGYACSIRERVYDYDYSEFMLSEGRGLPVFPDMFINK